jgi:CheY-like chemotaxis protein
MGEARQTVLVVDDDNDIADLVEEFLASEGYAVTTLRDRNQEGVEAAVERLRPDCVLLDGYARGSENTSWTEAAWIASQVDAVPVILFSADRQATSEAERNESERSHAAGFSSVLPKPFDLDELVRVVALAVSQSPLRRGSTG